MPEEYCAAMVLAAGASTRLGRSKQLISVAGESLLRRTTRLALEAGFSPLVVVLGSTPKDFKPQLNGLDVSIAYNEVWQQGMASSITCGLSFIVNRDPTPLNLAILVCDQPKLTTEILRQLLNEHRSHPAQITASGYAETVGVPAIFSSPLYGELAALSGNEGARRVIARHAAKVNTVIFPGGEDDIDTPESLNDGSPSEEGT